MSTFVKKPIRDTGPEILRIVAMIMIILHHIAIHGGLSYNNICFNSTLLSVIEMGGKIGVNIFILITGYYSVNSKPTIKKAVILIAEALFYSIILYGAGCLIGSANFRAKYIIYAVLPFLTIKGNWFITIYLLLYSLIPFINKGIKSLTQRQYICILSLFLFIWSVIPYTFGYLFKIQDYGFSTLAWFVFLYALGAYLKHYPIKLLNKKGLSFLLLIITSAVMIGMRIISELDISINIRIIGRLIKMAVYFFSSSELCSPMSVLFSVLALIAFLQIKVKPNKLIYLISGSTFGIYLIHDNDWIRDYLWNCIINIQRFAASKYLIIYVLIITFLIFTICCIIDIIRKQLFEKPFFNSSLYQNTESICSNLFDHLTEKLHIKH